MAWKKRKDNLTHKYPDLEFLPPGKSDWDCTLAALAYGTRMDIRGGEADLNIWAIHHGLPGSGTYERYGGSAMVLWHGTSRDRAEKIAEHGLFHKRGLWTAPHPRVPHTFCRMRATRFRIEGAVVCLVINRNQMVEGRDYEVEKYGNVIRFQHGLPTKVVQYILVQDRIQFVGTERAKNNQPWPTARFKHTEGKWRTIRQPPVRFSGTETFSTAADFVELCMKKVINELDGASPLEVLSVLYSLIEPWECLHHSKIIDMLEASSFQMKTNGKWKIFKTRI
jgi:hypothetical protein